MTLCVGNGSQGIEVAEMSGITGSELEKLGRAAAEHVAGDDAVEQVEVTRGEDASERPVWSARD